MRIKAPGNAGRFFFEKIMHTGDLVEFENPIMSPTNGDPFYRYVKGVGILIDKKEFIINNSAYTTYSIFTEGVIRNYSSAGWDVIAI